MAVAIYGYPEVKEPGSEVYFLNLKKIICIIVSIIYSDLKTTNSVINKDSAVPFFNTISSVYSFH